MDYLKKIEASVRFIEENLENQISLEDLAGQAYFSAYYFHRIFQDIVGEPVMEYIRKRRLAGAARELLCSDKNIIEIAEKYRFNTHDTFTRAFNRYYGITPQRYRRLNKSERFLEKQPNLKEVFLMYDWNISERLQCGDAEKRDCLKLFDSILNLSRKAKKHGLLSLESEIASTDSFLLRKALQLVIDGVETAYIREILHNYIISGRYSGKELLERLLIMNGILAIQAGENPAIIREKLSSLFGEDFAEEIDRHSCKTGSQAHLLEAHFEEIEGLAPFSASTALLEEPFQKLDDRSLQRLLRDIELSELVSGLKGASGQIQKRVLKNVSKKLAFLLLDGLREVKQVSPKSTVDSQKRILEIMCRLRSEGDIA